MNQSSSLRDYSLYVIIILLLSSYMNIPTESSKCYKIETQKVIFATFS